MSGSKLARGQRLMGKLTAAAVIATLTGIPSELIHGLVGDQDQSGLALAAKGPPDPFPGKGQGKGKKPKPPLPPPVGLAPQAEPLNADPNVQWFADWHENTNPAATNFFVTPSNLSGVPYQITQMNASAAAGTPLGIKLEVPLMNSQATSLFGTQYQPGKKAISYVFADFEHGSQSHVESNVKNLVNQVRGSAWSRNAYVGQFDLTPLDRENDIFFRPPPGFNSFPPGPPPGVPPGPPDGVPPGPPGGSVNPPIGSKTNHWGRAEYNALGVNMANTRLYPGGPDFRNASTGDYANANIRTGLFVGPIGRMTQVQDILNQSYHGTNLATGLHNHKQVPWVSRFNNVGNASLDNAEHNNLPFVFQPGVAAGTLSASQTQNQMLGRGDFSAQILHYRMRGAYSVNLFEPGVVGYTQAQMQQDVRDGWNANDPAIANNRLNAIFAQGDNRAATMTLNPIVDGSSASSGVRSESSGTIWSGQYSLTLDNPDSTNGKGALDVLVSNLDSVDHLVKFDTVDVYDVFTSSNNDGYTYANNSALGSSRSVMIEAGMHRLLQFDLVTTRVYNSMADLNAGNNRYATKTIWLLNQNYLVFGNNNRNEMGIPEPTTFGALAAAGAIAVVCRRQRRRPA